MSSPKDLSQGEHLFKEFHQFNPKNVGQFSSAFSIPARVTHVGEGAYVLYRSDKWEKKFNEYIHEHESGVKVCLVADGDGPSIAVPSWLRSAKTLVRLGDCLGFAYTDREGTTIEAKTHRPLPELYAIPSGRALLVVEGKKKLHALMWGGYIDVTARGIVG